MDYTQIGLLLAAPVSLGFGVANLFFTERYFYWIERRKYADPLAPSPFKIFLMRVNGILGIGLGLLLVWLVVTGQALSTLSLTPGASSRSSGSLFGQPHNETHERSNDLWQSNQFSQGRSPALHKRY